jgi:hypothetical protein
MMKWDEVDGDFGVCGGGRIQLGYVKSARMMRWCIQ